MDDILRILRKCAEMTPLEGNQHHPPRETLRQSILPLRASLFQHEAHLVQVLKFGISFVIPDRLQTVRARQAGSARDRRSVRETGGQPIFPERRL